MRYAHGQPIRGPRVPLLFHIAPALYAWFLRRRMRKLVAPVLARQKEHLEKYGDLHIPILALDSKEWDKYGA